jgi:capsular polysaccharide biosynthesis protein
MSALLEPRPRRLHVGRILLRRGGIVVLAVALVPLAAYFVASGLHRSYTAEALVVVPSGAGPHGPGNAQEADKLAVTYAAVIPEDDRVLGRIARTLGVATSVVKRELKVVTEEGTSLIRLRFTDDHRDIAVAGARAAAEAVTSRIQVTPSIAPRSVALVRFPATPDKSSRPATTIPIGVVLGLALGLILLVAWERADARTDDVASLEAETGCPAMPFGGLSTGSMTALLRRWETLAGRSAPRIALVAAATNAERATVAAAHRLYAAAELERMPIGIEDQRAGAAEQARPPSRSNGTGDPGAAPSGAAERGDRTTLVIGGVPGSDVAGEAVALAADFVVLVASPGTRAVDIRAAVAVLEQFGVSPGWALLAERPRTAAAARAPRLDSLLGRRREEAPRVSTGAADREAGEDGVA